MSFAIGDKVLNLNEEDDGKPGMPAVIEKGPYKDRQGHIVYDISQASSFGDFEITMSEMPQKVLVADNLENRADSAQRVAARQAIAVNTRRQRRAQINLLRREIEGLEDELMELETEDDNFDPGPEALQKKADLQAEFEQLAARSGLSKKE
jgi:cell division protein FtsB